MWRVPVSIRMFPVGQLMKVPDKIEVIVKLTERCNINCTYCYMFNKGNDEYLSRPAYMSEQTAGALAEFLAQAVKEFALTRIRVIFHGGEPMMMKPYRFERICELLEDVVAPLAELELAMQSNAMLVDDAWLNALISHDVGVGVSIDGPPKYHDVDRVDHKGGGTYDDVAKGLRRLQSAAEKGLLRPPGTISVIRPSFDGAQVYRHLVNDLGIRSLNFLLPIDTYDTFDFKDLDGYGKFMRDVYREWVIQGDSGVRVRFVDDFLRLLHGGSALAKSRRDELNSMAFFVVGSNGDIELDDSLKPIQPDVFGRWNVASTSLSDYISRPSIQTVLAESAKLPQECHECCWRSVCRGNAGRAITRYSKNKGFAQKSFLCEPVKRVYNFIAASALQSGLGHDELMAAIQSEDEEESRDDVKPVLPTSRAPITWMKSVA